MSPAWVTIKWLKSFDKMKNLSSSSFKVVINDLPKIYCNMAVEIERCDIFTDWWNLKTMGKR